MRHVAIDATFARCPVLWHLLIALLQHPAMKSCIDADAASLRDVVVSLFVGAVTYFRSKTPATALRAVCGGPSPSAEPLQQLPLRHSCHGAADCSPAQLPHFRLLTAQALVLTVGGSDVGWLDGNIAAVIARLLPGVASRDAATLLATAYQASSLFEPARHRPASGNKFGAVTGVPTAPLALADVKHKLRCIAYGNIAGVQDVYGDVLSL